MADKQKKKSYTNPMNTLWGKILIWVLCILMAGTGIISLIYVIVRGINGV